LELFEAFLLGVLQGFAEWLPVSSEGVILLSMRFLLGSGWGESLGTAVWLHLGTMLAAIAYFRKELVKVFNGFRYPGEGRTLLLFLITATACTAVTALPLVLMLRSLSIDDGFFTLAVGILILAVTAIPRRLAVRNILIGWPAAAVVSGLVQGLAIVPGVSRSGITITTLLILGYDLSNSLKLSYLMSIPAVAAAQIALPFALGYRLTEAWQFVGMVTAAVTGFAMVSILMKLSTSYDMRKVAFPLGFFLVLLGFLMLVG